MILSIDELVKSLEHLGRPNDAGPSDALWIRFSQERTASTLDFHTADDNQIVHVYLDKDGNLVGVEIFP